ncbi:MAG: hypothetical protein WC389_20845, partial [Lutibacter sp.]
EIEACGTSNKLFNTKLFAVISLIVVEPNIAVPRTVRPPSIDRFLCILTSSLKSMSLFTTSSLLAPTASE